jgi:hypothetical protein
MEGALPVEYRQVAAVLSVAGYQKSAPSSAVNTAGMEIGRPERWMTCLTKSRGWLTLAVRVHAY